MQFSNKYIFSKKENEKFKNLLIAQIAFCELQNQTREIHGKPVLCYSCGAALTDINSIIKDEIGFCFNCEFCGSLNKIPENQLTSLKELSEMALEYLTEEEEIIKNNDDNVIACIDISGSMFGNAIIGVKNSLIETINSFSVNSPDTGFALIAFTDYVVLYDCKGKEIKKIEKELLYSEEKISHIFSNSDYKFEKIKDSYKEWIKTISKLKAVSNTALGPAVIAAVSLLKGPGRIILLTDGLANLGPGSIQNVSGSGGKVDFYKHIGNKARDMGIMIEIVGVSTSMHSRVEMETIGEMAKLTGGDIYFISLSEISKTFNVISQADVLGRNVKVKFFAPKKLSLNDISGDIYFARKKMGLEAKLGNVNPDRKFCISINTEEDLEPEEKMPFQAQVEYTGLDGKKRTRIYTDKLYATNKEEDIIENLQSEITDLFYKQKSAEFGQRGQEKVGIEKLKNYAGQLKDYSKNSSEIASKRFAASSTLVEHEIEELKETEALHNKDAKYSLYQAKMSFGTTKNERDMSRRTRTLGEE